MRKTWGRRKAWVVVVVFFTALILVAVGAFVADDPWLASAFSLAALVASATFLFFLVRILSSSRAMMRALQRGDLDEVVERADRILATTRTSNLRNVTVITKSAALYEGGRHGEGVAELQAVPLDELSGVARLAYLNNLLLLMSHADPASATELIEAHHQVFESAPNPRYARHLTRALAAYRLMVLDDRDTKACFREVLDRADAQDTPTVQATCCYYLSVIADRNGDLAGAREWFDRGRQLRPNMNIGPRPVTT